MALNVTARFQALMMEPRKWMKMNENDTDLRAWITPCHPVQPSFKALCGFSSISRLRFTSVWKILRLETPGLVSPGLMASPTLASHETSWKLQPQQWWIDHNGTESQFWPNIFCQGSPRIFAISQVLRSCLSADVFLRSWTSKLQHINCGRIATSNLIYSFDSMNPSMWRNNMVQLLIEATAPIKFWVKEWCSAPAGQGCIDDAKVAVEWFPSTAASNQTVLLRAKANAKVYKNSLLSKWHIKIHQVILVGGFNPSEK